MSAPIEVLELREVTGRGNLRVFAKVRLGCLIVHGCRIIQEVGKRPWAALPQVPARKRADGSGAGWFPSIEITNPTVLDQVRRTVLAAWQADQQQPPAASGKTKVVKLKATDPRREQVDELAEAFDKRPPDEVSF